jgi:hypothetical protein
VNDANSSQHDVDIDNRWRDDVCLISGRKLVGGMESMVPWFWCVGMSIGGGMGWIRGWLIMVEGTERIYGWIWV